MITTPEIKKEVEDMEYDEIKTEFSAGVNDDVPPETEEDEETDKKELDLDSIDMMQLPIQLDDGIDILDEVKYVLFYMDRRPCADRADVFIYDSILDAKMKELSLYQRRS